MVVSHITAKYSVETPCSEEQIFFCFKSVTEALITLSHCSVVACCNVAKLSHAQLCCYFHLVHEVFPILLLLYSTDICTVQ